MEFSVRTLKARLEEMGLSPRKSRGQNFLVDRGSIQKILNFADIHPEEDVIEVGPGLGAISRELFGAGRSYQAIEIEQKFCDHLQLLIPELSPQRVYCEDVREIDLSKLSRALSGEVQFSLVSNVPYSLSSEVILWLIQQRHYFRRASLLLQREFAERVAAKPGGKDYGSLTVLRTLYADAKLGSIISGKCFYPEAEVESRLLEIRFLKEPRIPGVSQNLFEKVVRGAFSARRKVILNSLHSSFPQMSKQEITRRMQEVNLDPGRRAETFSVEEFAKLTDCLGPNTSFD